MGGLGVTLADLVADHASAAADEAAAEARQRADHYKPGPGASENILVADVHVGLRVVAISVGCKKVEKKDGLASLRPLID